MKLLNRRTHSLLLLSLLMAIAFASNAFAVSSDVGQSTNEEVKGEAVSTKTLGRIARLNRMAVKENEGKIALLSRELERIKNDGVDQPSRKRKAVSTALILILSIFLYLLLKQGLRHFEKAITQTDAIRESESVLRLKTIIKLFHWLGSLAVFFSMTYMVLKQFDVDVSPLIAGAGIAGLAFGFGGQYLIRDIINGMFILIEGQIRVNDVIKVGEFSGLVEDVNLRMTTLRDMEGKVIYIPNGEIKTVQNFTKDFSRAVLNIGVAYKENVDHVMEVIKEIGVEMRKDEKFGKLITDDLEMLGVDDFAESQVTIKFRIQTLPIKQWEVAREFRRRIKNKFDELGIEIPFPHRTLYLGAGPDNEWIRNAAAK